MGYFKCTILFNICTIIFHFYRIMTLVVPCLHNMFMVLLIFALGNIKIDATKPIFLDSGSPRGGGGGSCMRRHGLFSLYSSYTKFIEVKNPLFFVSNSDLCRAMLPNYLRTYSSALYQIIAVSPHSEKTLQKTLRILFARIPLGKWTPTA